jgi:chaperone modulatory protein CbpM
MRREEEILVGLLLDEECLLTLGELSRACRVHAEWIVELVEQGIIEPRGRELRHWRFSGSSLGQVMRVQRLQRDLGVNLAGAALALDLLDEIRALRNRLAIIERDL